jgi:hypothetical protein
LKSDLDCLLDLNRGYIRSVQASDVPGFAEMLAEDVADSATTRWSVQRQFEDGEKRDFSLRKPTNSSRKIFRDAKTAQERKGKNKIGLLRSVPQNHSGCKERK